MTDTQLFVEDIEVPGTLYGLTIRSPGVGRLVSITAPRLPSTYTLIQSTDIPGKNQLNDLPLPILAAETLSYIGEPVALLIGPDRTQLETYAAQCVVNIEAGIPLFSHHAFPREALIAERKITAGDPERAFAEAKTTVEGVYQTGLQEHWYPEPSGALAIWTAEKSEADVPHKGGSEKTGAGKIRIHTATQWPFQVKRAVTQALGIPPAMVAVEPSRLGIHLDGKIWYPSLLACHAALGAFITQKPVKIMLSRNEDFRYSPKRNSTEIRIRSALGERGQLLATEVTVLADLGAYGVFADEILDQTCIGALGAYKQNNIRIEGSAVAVNVPPAGPFAGFGMAQGFFAMERHASRIADTLHQNPVDWRKENVFNRKRNLAIGTALSDQASLEELLDSAASMGDYHRKWASYEMLRSHRRENKGGEAGEVLRGIGIAAAYQGSGFLYSGVDRGVYTVELTLDKEGCLEIRTSMVSSNREYITIWQNIAAETLSLEANAIRVVFGDTDLVPDSGPACLSRNITVVTKLVENACMAIRKQRFRDPLPITVRRSSRPVKVPNWEGKPIDQGAFRLGWAAAVVELEVDPIEYIPKVRGVSLVVDGGKILSEQRARRSLKFAVIQALGWASRERLSYEAGRIPDQQIHFYDIPDPRDIPPIHIDFVWNESSGARGIGELPYNCVPAAYVQAVSQAMDHPFERLPLSAREIWDAMALYVSAEGV
ncbi:aldehyde oxidase [Spirochaetia bacterium]|nr:aldehyde oxidase [Spirochaetia bacterium]